VLSSTSGVRMTSRLLFVGLGLAAVNSRHASAELHSACADTRHQKLICRCHVDHPHLPYGLLG
jgi:hypothetical protein